MTITASISPGLSTNRLSDEKFPIKDKSLHLSIEIRENELLACLLDKHNNKYIAWGAFTLNAKENSLSSILKEDLFASSVAETSVVFTPNSSLLVPAPFFKKEMLNDYLGFQHLNKQNENPCFDYIKNLDSYNLYTVNNELLDTMKKTYPNASFRHHSSIFIEFVLIENKNTHDDKVFVTMFGKYMDIVVLQAGKLTLSNRFYYVNDSDFMYYLLWVYEQLSIDTEKASCVFYGETDNAKYNLAAKYIKKVSTGTRNNYSGYIPVLDKLPPHKYRSLFTQYLCV